MTIGGRKLTLRAGGLALVIAAIVGIAKLWGIGLAIQHARDVLRVAGPGVFFSAMAVLPAIGAPISLFTFPVSAAFGDDLGTGTVVVYAVAAVAVDLALGYWLAAWALRPFIERLVKWMGFTLPDTAKVPPWEITLLVRIIPGPPLFLQSYLLGLARVPFVPYMVVSVLVSGTYTALTVVAVDGMRRGDPWTIAGAAVVLVVVVLTVRRLRRKLREAQDEPAGEGARN